MAWNIGANDVANAMGTSVGSKALTLKRAVFLAAILEFSGAFFVGSHVSLTIQKGIIDPQIFSADPMIFVLGMMGSLLATGILLQIASYFGLPISTTHAIVGAVVGFGAAVGGIDAIRWSEVGWIGASWVVSPLLSGIFAYLLYLLIRKKILHAPNPLEATQKLAPFFVFLCFQIISLCLIYNGLAEFNLNLSLVSSLSLSSSVSLTAAFLSYRWIKPSLVLVSNVSGFFEETAARQRRSIEKTFIFLQILSACLVAFAHGANDVANAIGPVAAILGVLKTHAISSHSQVPTWLLALGGAGIVIGLATWGWRVIETVGSKITELTPTRGFAAELGAAITILFASKLGLPISTTHALVGAVLGVGMVRGLRAINLQTLKEIVISWLVTIPFCAGLSIAMFYLLKWVLL
jgi:phosphate/sulfate permease